MVSQVRHLRNLLPKYLQLSLPLFQLQVNHPDLLLLLPNLLLSVLQSIFLDIRLLVQNTQLIVAVNKLDSHVITRFTSLFILVYQVVHFALERVDDQVEFVTFVDFLADVGLFLLEL